MTYSFNSDCIIIILSFFILLLRSPGSVCVSRSYISEMREGIEIIQTILWLRPSEVVKTLFSQFPYSKYMAVYSPKNAYFDTERNGR